MRVLFNNKILGLYNIDKMSGIWIEECENELCTIKAGKITKVQKMIIKQIEEWNV